MNPITREESLLDGQDLTPITRKEQFIKRIYDKTQEVPTPVTREEWFLKKAGEGTSPVTIEQLNVTENGTYSEEGKAYSPVIVEVPAPTLITKTITENGTYTASEDNADGYSQVTVNVPLPQNAKLITTAESYPITDAADYPLPKCEVAVANADKCEVIVTSDNTITENNVPYLYRATPSGNRVLNELVGGTVAYNQLVQSADTSCTVPNNHKYVFHHGTTYDVAISDGTAFTVDGSANDNVHNITQAFGTTIADYIYSLEQAEAGSGIAWLKSYGFLTEDYYPYNAGELMSVKTSARKVYDSDSNLLATYPLSNIELRGIPKLVNNQFVYDGDRYEGNGRVTRKYGIVNLGTLTWVNYPGLENIFQADGSPLGYKPIELGGIAKAICANYILVTSAEGGVDAIDRSIALGTGTSTRIYAHNSAYTDATAFKTAMNGVYLVYEKATPTTEQTYPYDNPQLAGSTEEFVDTREVAIPVGHESKYFNGEGYITYLEPNTSDTIDMAQEHAIMPLETTYISANGTLDVEYWK